MIITLNKCTVITDVPHFFDTHLKIMETANDKLIVNFSERLKQALVIVGIDINELAKNLK